MLSTLKREVMCAAVLSATLFGFHHCSRGLGSAVPVARAAFPGAALLQV
jgi:hypothetical protein